eukprot:jgi/Orpsp1_1/1180135/evm.model.c7180000072264.1
MAKSNGNFKRHYPKLGKCICCCCCSRDTAVKVSTYILLIFEIYGIIYNILNSFPHNNLTDYNVVTKVMTYTTFAFSIIISISYILLLFGINKVKPLFLNQFKIIYLIYLIYSICSIIYLYILVNNDDYIKYQIDVINKQYEEEGIIYSSINRIDREDTRIINSVKNGSILAIFTSISLYGLL